MKHSLRLEYARLAEALAEGGLVDPKSLRDALQFSSRGGTPFPRQLVEASLVTDWELSRVVCELYGLPFLTVEIAEPDQAAFASLDPNFLVEHALVPLGRYGQILTVCMPALVEADVLGMMSAQTDLLVLPVVGTVRSNQLWLERHLSAQMPENAIGDMPEELAEAASGWGSFFDDADAAVLMDLDSTVLTSEPVTDEDAAG